MSILSKADGAQVGTVSLPTARPGQRTPSIAASRRAELATALRLNPDFAAPVQALTSPSSSVRTRSFGPRLTSNSPRSSVLPAPPIAATMECEDEPRLRVVKLYQWFDREF
jgi:hypothetical protein